MMIEQRCESYTDALTPEGVVKSAWLLFVDDSKRLAKEGWFVVGFAPVSLTASRSAAHTLGVVYRRETKRNSDE